MKLRVQDQEEDQRKPGEVVREDCQARKLNKEDAMDRCKWRKVIDPDGCEWVNVFFWYRPTRVVPDQRPLNGRCCCCLATVLFPRQIVGKSSKDQSRSWRQLLRKSATALTTLSTPTVVRLQFQRILLLLLKVIR